MRILLEAEGTKILLPQKCSLESLFGVFGGAIVVDLVSRYGAMPKYRPSNETITLRMLSDDCLADPKQDRDAIVHATTDDAAEHVCEGDPPL